MGKTRFKKATFLLMVLAMIISVFSPITSLAASPSERTTTGINVSICSDLKAGTSPSERTTTGINEELKSKADPFIYLDHKTEEFKVEKEAKDVLTDKELKQVKEVIKTSNSTVKEHRSDLIIEGNEFVGKEQPVRSEKFQAASIDKKKAFDYEFTWWGLKVYWSHSFVKKLKENILLYGAGTAALNATIVYYLSPPGWVTSFISACAGIGLWGFLQQDKGCGVYLDCYLYVPTAWYSAC